MLRFITSRTWESRLTWERETRERGLTIQQECIYSGLALVHYQMRPPGLLDLCAELTVCFFIKASPLLERGWRWSPRISDGLSPQPQSCWSPSSAPRRRARTSCSPRWTQSAGTAWSSRDPLHSSSPSRTSTTRSGRPPAWAADSEEEQQRVKSYFILSAHLRLRWRPAEAFHYLSSQFMGPSVRRSQADRWTVSSSLLTVRLRGNM